MTVTEKLGALGSWSVRLSDHTPEDVRGSLDYFGHVALIRGRVNPADHGDTLLRAARYVGVLRRRQGDLESELSGSGMVFWLGDEDDKGAVLESKVTLTNATLAQSVQAILDLCPAVQLGTILATPAGTYTGSHQWQTPREALQIICDAFGVEFRVNGDATVDVGTQAQLYATTPDSLVVRKGAGSDLDLSALTGKFEPDTSVIDYSTRVVLVGQTLEDGTFATGSAELTEVPYVDLHGNPVRFVRLISESDQTEGSVEARSQLQLNRFARVARSLKVTAERYETDGTFTVGDNAYVYDPDTGIVSPDYEVTFRGQVLHPDVVRIAGITWPVSEDHTVAFRTQAGEWIDLTRWVVWETGENELTLGDLPRSLTGGGGNPVLDRQQGNPADTIPPNPPTGLTLSSWTATGADGHEAGFIDATWIAPTTNADGSVVTDLSHFLVAWKWTQGGTFQYATVDGADTDATLQAVPGLPFEVWVGAYDTGNNFSGWSVPETITVTQDQTAPLAPSDPTVGNYLGQLRIVWDGLMADGSQPPVDFARVDVHVGTADGFTPTEATRVASLSSSGEAYATADYGVPAWVRLVAFDHTGNASDPSGSVSGTTSKVVSDDILDGAVGTAKLADLAVTNAKIGLLAVNDANIGNLNVGKLLGGILEAGVVVGGSISTTPTPEGRYASITSDAIEAWADAATQTVRLDGIANLLTGTLQTALTGRRMVAGAAGATGEISFYAPDGTRGLIRSLTEGAGADGIAPEAIQLGIDVPGAGSLWGRLNYNHSAHGEYATYRSGTHEFVFDSSAVQTDALGNTGVGRFVVFETGNKGADPSEARFTIDGGSTRFWHGAELALMIDTDGTRVYYKTQTDGTPRERLKVNRDGFYVTDHGQDVRFTVDAGGLLYTGGNGQQRLQIADVGSTGLVVRDETGATRIWQRDNIFTIWGSDDLVDVDIAADSFKLTPGAGDKRGWIEVLTHPSYGVSPRLKFVSNRVSATDGNVYVGNLRLVQGAFEFHDVTDTGWARVWTGRLDVQGDVVATGGGFYNQSDASAKTGIRTLEPGALDKVLATRVTRYQWRSRDDGREEVGLIAQEAPPEIVRAVEDGVLGVDLYGMAALTWAAVRELAAQVAEMRKDAA